MTVTRRVPAGAEPASQAQASSLAYLRRLEELGAGDVEIAGRKAANLGVLAQRGFPVPPGVVVSAGTPDEALADQRGRGTGHPG